MACNRQHGPATYLAFVEEKTGWKVTQDEWHELRQLAKADGLEVSRATATPEDAAAAARALADSLDTGRVSRKRLVDALDGVKNTKGTVAVVNFMAAHGPSDAIQQARDSIAAKKFTLPWTKGDFVASQEDLTVRVPAGKYWVCDPCYVVRDSEWMPWLEAAHYEDNRLLLCANTPSGYPVLGLSTQYGDGSYRDEDGNEYGVDAGLIGLIPYEYDTTGGGWNTHGGAPMGRLVEFKTATDCEIDMAGDDFRGGNHHILRFGNVAIETGDGDPEPDVCHICGEELEYGCSCYLNDEDDEDDEDEDY